MSVKAPFIVIEGTEFSGKSTQVDHVVEYLNEKGIFEPAVKTRVPQGDLRALLLADSGESYEAMSKALINAAGFVEVGNKIIKPAIEANKPVVCDRWYPTSIVIQGLAELAGEQSVSVLNRIADVLVPDVVIILLVDDDVLDQRAKARHASGEINFYDKKSGKFNKVVRNGYRNLKYIHTPLLDTIVYVDGNGTVDEVKLNIRQVLDDHLFNSGNSK